MLSRQTTIRSSAILRVRQSSINLIGKFFNMIRLNIGTHEDLINTFAVTRSIAPSAAGLLAN